METGERKRFIVEFDFQDGNGWIDISSYTLARELRRQRYVYKQLKPTTDECTFKIKYNESLINKLLFSESDIKARIKKVSFYDKDISDGDDEYSVDVIEDYFIGWVEKDYKMKSSSRVDWVDISIIDNNYMLDRSIENTYTFSDFYLMNHFDKENSIIHKILYDAGFTDDLIFEDVAMKSFEPLVIEHFKHLVSEPLDSSNAALSELPYGGSYQEIITNLLFQYGYSYFFTPSGQFRLFDFKANTVAVTSGPYFNEINNSNMIGSLTFQKKMPSYEAVEITWNNREYYNNVILFNDSTGAQGLESQYPYCKIPIAAGGYYPENATASFIPSVAYLVQFDDGKTTDDIISVESAYLVDEYSAPKEGSIVANTGAEYWDPEATWIADYTPKPKQIYGWKAVDSSSKCKGLIGSVGQLIVNWISDTKYSETKCTGWCCRNKVLGVCVNPGLKWKTTYYQYMVIDTITYPTVPAHWEGAWKVRTPVTVDFSTTPLSFNLRVRNDDVIESTITRFQIYGDVVVRGDTNITIDQRSGITEKKFGYKAPYITNEDDALLLANNIYDYYKYSTFTYKIKSFEEFEPGEWVTITDNNFKNIDGYPVANKFCLVISRKDIEFNETHEYELEEYKPYDLKIRKEYISWKPLIKISGRRDKTCYTINCEYIPSGIITLSGEFEYIVEKGDWVYTPLSGGIILSGGGTYQEGDNHYVYNPIKPNIKALGTAPSEEFDFYDYSASGIIQSSGNSINQIDHIYSSSGSIQSSGSANGVLSTYTFTSVWKTDNIGDSQSNQIKLPFDNVSPGLNGGYQNHLVSCQVYWGDGTYSTLNNLTSTGGYREFLDQEVTHTYETPGTYTVNIYGICNGFGFSSYNVKEGRKLLDITVFGGGFSFNNNGYQLAYTSLTNISATDTPDLSNISNATRMFSDSTIISGVGDWDVSSITNMYLMFYNATAFNDDIGDWDVSNVTNMGYMFYNANVFNQDIGEWDVSNVTNMEGLFLYASVFNQDISEWDTSSSTKMNAMFSRAIAFNQDISSWDVSNVTNMNNMFQQATVFNQDISEWDTSKVTRMGYMFSHTSAFNQDISSWDVSNVTSTDHMFYYAKAFNQDISEWDTSKVTNMSYMFYYASAFNQDLTGFDISGLDSNIIYGTLYRTFSFSGLSTINYTKLLQYFATLNKNSIRLGADNIKSSGAEDAKAVLISKLWTIADGGII